MKNLAKSFLIYVFPILLLVLWIETGLLALRNSYSQKKILLEQNLAEHEVLILGNSLPWHGINPGLISARAFNLSMVSQSLFYDLQFVARYTPQMPALKTVILCVDYTSLEDDINLSPEYWRSFFYERFFGFPLESDKFSWDIMRFSLIKLYGGTETLRLARNLFRDHLDYEQLENGFAPRINPGYLTNESEARKRVDFLHTCMNPSAVARNSAYLRQIIRLLRSKGIVPVLVSLPVSSGYTLALDQNKLQRMQGTIKTIAAESEISYHNYMFDQRFTAEDFFDADHLAVNGAIHFTNILNLEVVKPLLNTTNPD